MLKYQVETLFVVVPALVRSGTILQLLVVSGRLVVISISADVLGTCLFHRDLVRAWLHRWTVAGLVLWLFAGLRIVVFTHCGHHIFQFH